MRISAHLARTGIVLLCACAALAADVHTPVFRGAMGMGGHSIALFEVQGNTGTWQGEMGRTLPGTSWRIEKIDLASGQVTIRVPGHPPVTLKQGDTYLGDRAVKAPEVERPPAPPPPERPAYGNFRGARGNGGGAGLPGLSMLDPAMQQKISAALRDPRVTQQLRSMGLTIPRLDGRSGLTFGGTSQLSSARIESSRSPAQRATTAHAPTARATAAAASPSEAPPPPSAPAPPPRVPLIRALDASKTVPDMGSLARPGDDTVVMIMGSDAASRALKPRVLSLASKRPRTALVFVDVGAETKAPVIAAWNVPALPHFLLLDPSGGVAASGEKARATVDDWLSGK